MQSSKAIEQENLKILSKKNFLTSIKCHNYVTNTQKITGNNLNLDIVRKNAYTKFGEILSICSQDIERNKVLTLTKGHYCVINKQKMTANKPKLDLDNMNAYARIKFGEILSICSQDIEPKRNSGVNQGS